MRSGAWRTVIGWLAITMAAAAPAMLLQGPDANSAAHYALIRSLSMRSPAIDKTRVGVMEQSLTNDVLLVRGHVYANKAPGLGFVTLPAYIALDRAGVRTAGEATRVIWALGLWGVVLPALAAMALVWRLADRVAPGYGIAAATVLGTGTLLFVFDSLFFSHPLSAFLCIAAFAMLWIERERSPRLALVFAAGLIAGYAVTTEYPNVVAAGILGVYAVTRGDVVRRAAAYGLGGALGIAPLLAYQWWAFGSIGRVPYEGTESGPPLAEAFHWPSIAAASALWLWRWGLLVISPVLVAGIAGLVPLYRKGWRAEALAIACIAAAYTVFISAFYSPFGAVSLPRYLITILPFLGVPLSLSIRACPLTVCALGLGSALVMVAVTATQPLALFEGRVIERFSTGAFAPTTVTHLVGVTGWYDVAPFFALAIGAVVCAIALTPGRVTAVDLRTSIAAVGGWVLFAIQTGAIFGSDLPAFTVALFASAFAVSTAAVVVAAGADGWRGLAGAPLLAATALPGVSPEADAALVAAALCVTLVVERDRIAALAARGTERIVSGG